jgi:hypothetical protein
LLYKSNSRCFGNGRKNIDDPDKQVLSLKRHKRQAEVETLPDIWKLFAKRHGLHDNASEVPAVHTLEGFGRNDQRNRIGTVD